MTQLRKRPLSCPVCINLVNTFKPRLTHYGVASERVCGCRWGCGRRGFAFRAPHCGRKCSTPNINEARRSERGLISLAACHHIAHTFTAVTLYEPAPMCQRAVVDRLNDDCLLVFQWIDAAEIV